MDTAAGLPAGVLLASFCVFQLLFHVLSSRFSAAVSPGFSRLSFEKKIEWNSRVASTCHSLVVGTLGLYLFFFDEATIADPLWWFLETLQYPKFSRANVLNGVLMTAVFFLARVAAMPPMYHLMYSVVGTEAYARLGPTVQASWAASCLVLDVMNITWMVKISRGCLKVLSLLRDQKASGRLQNGKLD
ncbi:hypothetical protein HJG60_019201 [Phyllostomus discolor]|uniref:TLC domain-containing protein n=1 Tax=Phyllostomus discolor TaxID=89673 RepID=A0A833YL10_9CHIR|nr:hypothetical protein HJG60_019201 [Phyllostomus discolor]